MDGEKNQFIHDLRNPLNTISINAELGKLTLERTGDVRKAISIFDTILTECHHCGNILDELRSVRFIGANEDDEW